MRKYIIIFILINLLLSCNEDENTSVIEVTTEDFKISMEENPNPMQEIGYIIGSSNKGNVTFEIESQNPNNAFSIDAESGLLIVADVTKFDYETYSVITGVIKVSNQNINEFATVTITLNDVQDIIITTEDFEITINEGPQNQEILGIVEATTNQGQLSFNIIEQNPNNAFSINEVTGELKVENTGLFNYETNPIVKGIVEIKNGNVSAISDITINLLDVEEKFLLLSSINSTFNFSRYDIGDQNHEIRYENGEINSWFNQYGVLSYNMRFVTDNNLIINHDQFIVDRGTSCNFQYTISYDNFNRITNIGFVGEGCEFYLKYNIDYDGSTVNFIDQINTNHKSIVLNSNDQIVNYKFNSYSVDFIYNDDNLINMSDSNGGSVTYEYDSYRNPFRLDETLNFAQIQDFINVIRGDFLIADIGLLPDRSNNFLRNRNNIVRLVRSNVNSEIEINYHYNYNSDDYPINKIMDIGNGVAEYFYE
ncbi:cadherin repeat domain-containing protein [Aquimarina sp. RZ0]|nr:cadherin repeat domain-containing protein [Aquimarina sp. RZ0]